MTRAILYYPTIVIRNMNWLKQAVLYWDEVGTIVPHQAERDARKDEIIRILSEHNLIRFFSPESYVEQNQQLTQEFISLRLTPKYASLNRHFVNSRQRFQIYRGKIPPELENYLLQNKLAVPEENYLLSLSRLDGLLYMSLLAKYLADEDTRAATIPGTDYRMYCDLIFASEMKAKGMPVLSFTLERILPVPRSDVTLGQVIEFKQQRMNELLQFRQVIDEFQAELKSVSTNGELQLVITKFSERIRSQVVILDRLFTDAGLAATYSTLDTLMSIEKPEVLAELLETLSNPIPLSIVAKVIRGAIKVRKQRIDAVNEQRRTLTASCYTYLFHAQREGIIASP